MQPSPDRYQLVRRLRATPQVQSYEARHPRRPGRFLVEVLGSLAGDAREAFERDLAAISQLRHPYMLQTLELSQLPDGTPIVVSELPDGPTLEDRLQSGVVAPLPSVLGLIDALAQALQAAQSRGVTHGTLDATSVFLVPNMGSALGIPRLHGFGRHWLLDHPPDDPIQQDLVAFAGLAGRLLNSALPGLDQVLERARDPEHALAFESPQAFNEALQDLGRGWMAATGEETAVVSPARRRRRSFVRMGLSASGLVTAGAVAVMIAGGLEPQLRNLSSTLVIPGRALATAGSPELAPAAVLAPLPPAPELPVAPALPAGPALSTAAPTLAAAAPALAPDNVVAPGAPAPKARRVRTPRPSEPPLYRGKVWSARLNRLVEVDEVGLPLDAEFPSVERAAEPEPQPIEPPPLPLPSLPHRTLPLQTSPLQTSLEPTP
jgi:hypothetical protein